MTKAVAFFKGGITGLKERALSEHGYVFVRYQEKTRYGYAWTRWKCGSNPTKWDVNDPETPSKISKFYDMYQVRPGSYPVNEDGTIRCRLP